MIVVLHHKMQGFEFFLHLCTGFSSSDPPFDMVSDSAQFFDMTPLFLQQLTQTLLLLDKQQCKSLQLGQLLF